MKSKKTLEQSAEAIFASHVLAAVEKAVAIGAKPSWDTEKHLSALAELIADCDTAEEQGLALRGWYNISGYQKMLESRFKAKGWFAANKRKVEGADDYLARLAASL
jgi:hypothetical protein